MYSLSNLKKYLLDILYPVYCLGCSRSGIWLCSDCLAKIKIENFFRCPICNYKSLRGQPHPGCAQYSQLDGLLIATGFQDTFVQKIIHRFKYNFIQDLAQPLSELLFQKIILSDYLFYPHLTQGYFDYFVPVPLHKRRQLWRGFNQAEELALSLIKQIRVDYLPCIKRTRYTSTQTNKKRNAREKNLQGAFVVLPDFIPQIKNKKVLLIDDVYTTGSTMQEVAGVLKQAEADEVWGIAIARG